ncbi:hypothetical protein FSARC_11660 [Fusarium sarcochroum]|uniref:Uncharacterized protein n=1 Tax=Fusarium sarcochroum TaxID=1208366 RepID=A0A8H4TDT3_9HYPO|nr:hypothetical protein FSARC_11660 [Fusarium sarcochroum]
MEAATKTVQQLTQRILPEKPHHLSYSSDWRYHIPANESRQKHPEEWDNTRLQYSTLVSEADRGVLLTRSYYDMRVEPPKPVPRDVGILAKGGEKKKLSLSDYKNKKTSGVTSDTSTPEPPSAKKRELERASAEPRSVPEIRKPDSQRQRDPHPDTKPQKPRELPVVDMRLPPKPPSLPPRPVSPDSRKRSANVDDDHRSQKRHRPDVPRAGDDRPRPARDEPPRRKDRDSLAPSDIPPRDKPISSSSLSNGRSVLKGANASSARNPSPAGRARGDSVNGVRPGASGSTRGTPVKGDNASRSSVPPLLSPLHLSWDSQNSADKADKRRAREDAVDSTRLSKPKKLEPPPPKPRNDTARDKSPLRLPALLSPTLPSALEAELSRRKVSGKTTESKAHDDRDKEEPNEKRSEDRHKSTTARKAPVEQEEEEDEDSSPRERKRLIVTLRISKRMRQTLKRILALPPKRRERSESTEAPAPQAKKRPATTEHTGDTIAVKRPRMPSVSSLPPPPSTPSKKGTTAMSRVSSSNSQAHTPGDTVMVTPVPPGSSDRPATNGTDAARGDKADHKAVFEKHVRFSTLGRRLKHEGDVANQRCNKLASSGDTRGSDSSRRHYYALAVESTVAFMTSFHLLNVSRNLQHKPSDPTGWSSLIKMVDYLQKETRRDMRRYQPIYALVLILQANTVDEFLKSFSDYERISKEELFLHQAIRYRNWPLVREVYDSIDSSHLRADITPWSTVEEVCQASMRVIRRWCADENVNWSPEFDPKEASIRVAR